MNAWDVSVSGARLIGSLRQNLVFSGTPTCHSATKVPDALVCAALNFTRSCSGLPCQEIFGEAQVNLPGALIARRHDLPARP